MDPSTFSAALHELKRRYDIPSNGPTDDNYNSVLDRLEYLGLADSFSRFDALKGEFFDLVLEFMHGEETEDMEQFHAWEFKMKLDKDMTLDSVADFANFFDGVMTDLLHNNLHSLPASASKLARLLPTLFELDYAGWSGSAFILDALKDIELRQDVMPVMGRLYAKDLSLLRWHYIANNEPWERSRFTSRFNDDWHQHIHEIVDRYDTSSEPALDQILPQDSVLVDSRIDNPTNEHFVERDDWIEQPVIGEEEIQLVPFNDYTPGLQAGDIAPESAYHGFFTLFCHESARPENRLSLQRFRKIFFDAADMLQLSPLDLQILERGTQRQVCKWMQEKQNERCTVCKSGNQYDVEVFSQEPVNTIPLLFLWISQDRYCFDIITLRHYLQIQERPNGTLQAAHNRHPLNGLPFPPEEIRKIHERYSFIYNLMRAVHEMI